MPPKRKNPKKRNFKRNYQKQRAKREETKKRETMDIAIRNSTDAGGTTFSANYPSTIKATAIAGATAITFLPLRSFYRISKGTRPNQMEGNEIFHKSLYAKVKVQGLPANNSVEIFLVHGWIRDKLGFTQFTSPSTSTATRSDVESFILNQLKQRYDEATDEMRFADKKLDNVQVLGYRKLQHPLDAAYNDSIDVKCSWKTNRKVPYTRCYQPALQSADPWMGNNEKVASVTTNGVVDHVNVTDSTNAHGELGGDVGQYLPLNSHLPFMCLYCPQFASVSPSSVTVGYNDVSYFTG